MAEFNFSSSKLMPNKLDVLVDRGETFNLWVQRWNDFVKLSKLDESDKDVQMAVLRSCLTDDTLKVVMNIDLPAPERDVPKSVIQALKTHIHGQMNIVIERRNFNLRGQQAGESFDDFLTDLRELAKTCSFCDACEESLLRDRIVIGLRDSDTVERLLAEKDLSLARAIELCRAEESAKRHRSEISGEQELNAISSYRKHKQKSRPRARRTDNNESRCVRCNKVHSETTKCPAIGSTCAACGQNDHWAKSELCSMKQVNKKLSVINLGSLLAPTLAAVDTRRAPRVEVCLGGKIANGVNVLATPETGAEGSACGLDTLKQVGIDPNNLRQPTLTLRAADNHSIAQLGEFDATIKHGKREATDTIHVLQGTSGLYLSWYLSQDLGLIPQNYPQQDLAQEVKVAPTISVATAVDSCDEIKVSREDLIKEYPEVFNGKIKPMPSEEFKIQLTDDATPFCVKAPRNIPYAYRDKLKNELDRMLDSGIIVPVTEPTAWCAPVVVTPKKNSENIRLCVDFTKLNKFVKRELYQSPSPHEAVADIAATNASYFTKFDALSGYWQCTLEKDSRPLTTFITPFGRFMFQRAPFGICSISEHYNRRMDEALSGLPHQRKIVDDMIAYDASFSDHVQHVRQILTRCTEKGISLNADKFLFAESEVDFCGYRLSRTGYSIYPEITKAIREFPTPTNITDLRSFFGLANQLTGFTDILSQQLETLRPLLQPKNVFRWDSIHDEAFEKAKIALSTTPVLAYYDPKKHTTLHVDARLLVV